MFKRNMLRVVVSGWVLALAVSVVPVDSVVSGEPVAKPALISEQTNSGGDGCDRCLSLD